jgi:SAM-dependent methyltransferase
MTSFDYQAERAINSLDEAKTSLTALVDKATLLSAAFSRLDTGQLPDFEPPEGAYAYIPLDISDFLDAVLQLEGALKNDPDYKHSDLPYRPCAYLEAGCGTGRNIFLLKSSERFHFHKIVGFDISESYIAHGKQYFRLKDEIFVDDCMTFDYGGFDIIYFYKPFHDDLKQRQFEQQLINTAKRGAYIVAFNASSFDESRLLMRMTDSGRIWKKL